MKSSNAYKPTLSAVLREALRGKSVGRTLTNLFWRDGEVIDGALLDIGGGDGGGSHYRFLPIAETAIRKTVDMISKQRTDFVLDITADRVPLSDASQDCILLFNVLEHLERHDTVLEEIARLLRPGGRLIGTIPFLVNVHPDPHDYIRLTNEGLAALFARHGFSMESLVPIGRGPFLAAYCQLDCLLPRIAHLVFLPIAWLLDSIVHTLKPQMDLVARFPLAYNFILRKN